MTQSHNFRRRHGGAARDTSRDYVDADGKVRLIDVTQDFPTGFAAAMRESSISFHQADGDILGLARAVDFNGAGHDEAADRGDAVNHEDVAHTESYYYKGRPAVPRVVPVHRTVRADGAGGPDGAGDSSAVGARVTTSASAASLAESLGNSNARAIDGGTSDAIANGSADTRCDTNTHTTHAVFTESRRRPSRRELRMAKYNQQQSVLDYEPRRRSGRHRQRAGKTAVLDSRQSILHSLLEDPMQVHSVDVLVIGGGQAGISAAYELQRRGFVGYAGGESNRLHHVATRGTFIVLDAEKGPGGAWQHRWDGLTMETVNGIADLPYMPLGDVNPHERSNVFVPRYFAEFEHEFDLPVLRPVRVVSVKKDGDWFISESSAGIWKSKFIINATGTWTRPFIPFYPGVDTFKGKQYHSKDFPGVQKLWGKRVLVVGGGISAIDHIREIYKDVKTLRWVTRTPPRWRGIQHERGLTPEAGRDIEAKVRERVEQGLAPLPVVAMTGLPLTDELQELRELGVFDRRPMFDRIDADGAWWGDHHEKFHVIIWATGFRAEQRHLRALNLRSSNGGIVMEGTRTKVEPHLHLLGYGPSASTIGARRDARVIVRQIIRDTSA